ncbi:AP-3 complex subunit delta-1 [Porphyridium purpureum]|uniref:AP-3 complex subunit delta-1 n=1 Tax=Porphyridium purpureum TaxID=35688 RepID=A0A5J4Z2E0_PORPP|nr:AP-3 complex subunit delta-1 [Porphyridium purpureum]|eukprot:POR9406..scf208_2
MAAPMSALSSAATSIFRQSLQDLVKSIRAHRRDEQAFVEKKLVEIQDECRSSEPDVKANAVLKLTYLQMFGHPAAGAAFCVVEVMSRAEYTSKRIGYLAAGQLFSPYTDVLLLTINQFKKDLTNGRQLDCSLALCTLSKIVTEEMGRECSNDILTLLSSSRPVIRKKALVCAYKLGRVCPEAQAVYLPRLRDAIADSNPAVLSCAVSVLCEMAGDDPQLVLPLAPYLYELFGLEHNNWMRIKLVKLMGMLAAVEPRLAKKLVKPLSDLLSSTSAKSLQYECCRAVARNMAACTEVVDPTIDRIADFLEDRDQNLKYLGLELLLHISAQHASAVKKHQQLILDCINDTDLGIRMIALQLTRVFLTPVNARDIATALLAKISEFDGVVAVPGGGSEGGGDEGSLRKSGPDEFGHGQGAPATQNLSWSSSLSTGAEAGMVSFFDQEHRFRDLVCDRLLEIGQCVKQRPEDDGGSSTGSKMYYPLLSSAEDFDWYISDVLKGLIRMGAGRLSHRTMGTIAKQLEEICARVNVARESALQIACEVLSDFVGDEMSKASALAAASPVVSGHREGVDAQNQFHGTDPSMVKAGFISHSEAVVASSLWVLGAHGALLSEDFLYELIATLLAADSQTNTSNSRLLQCGMRVQAFLISATMKLIVALSLSSSSSAAVAAVEGAPSSARLEHLLSLVSQLLKKLLHSSHAEVQERANLCLALLQHARDTASFAELEELFVGEFRPVDSSMQGRIPAPDGLNLDEPLAVIEDEEGKQLLYTNDPETGTQSETSFAQEPTELTYTPADPEAFWGPEGAPAAVLESTRLAARHANGKAPVLLTSGKGTRAEQQSPFYLGSGSGASKGTVSSPSEGLLIDLSGGGGSGTQHAPSFVGPGGTRAAMFQARERSEWNDHDIASPIELIPEEQTDILLPEPVVQKGSSSEKSASVVAKKSKAKKSKAQHPPARDGSLIDVGDAPSEPMGDNTDQKPSQRTADDLLW